MSYMSCPACGLSIRVGPSSLTVERCPRCLARRKQAVAMILSDRPAGRVATREPPAASPGVKRGGGTAAP